MVWENKDNQHREWVEMIIPKQHKTSLLNGSQSVKVCYIPVKAPDLASFPSQPAMHLQVRQKKETMNTSTTAYRQQLKNIPSHDVMTVQGNFNARVGSNYEGRERTMGKEGIGDTTCNEDTLFKMSMSKGRQAYESDSNLLIGKLALNLRKTQMEEQRHPCFDKDPLKDSGTLHN